MKKTLIICFLTCLILGCSSKKNNDQTQSVNAKVEQGILTCQTDINSNSPFENDSLIYNTLRTNSNVSVTFDAYKNRHVENTMDTVFHFAFDASKISFYKTNSELWVYKMILKSPEFKTKFGLSIGDKITNEFDQYSCTAIEEATREFILSEIEGLTTLKFKLDNKKITEIVYDGYAD